MIPPQQANGVLPPFVGTDATLLAAQSPYRATPEEFAARFATSAQRVDIVKGWLEHRAVLNGLGFTNGFQWLGGSYCEVMSREPNDIDVVTFFADAVNVRALAASHPAVFKPAESKSRYKCDAYFVTLSRDRAPVDLVRYWYALFAHRRDRSWKGMLRIDLDPTADARALSSLSSGAAP